MSDPTENGAVTPCCNICGGRAFGDTYGRPDSAFLRTNVRCLSCDSLERHRLLFEWLDRNKFFEKDLKILHLAPEPCLARFFSGRYGSSYRCGDVDTEQYRNIPTIEQIDLCRDLTGFEKRSFDLVIHNHVLEHLPCDYADVARQLHALVRPGGYHIFALPFLPGGYREHIGVLDQAERSRLFGQVDHMRIFSPHDLADTLGSVLPISASYDATELVPRERLREINIPECCWFGFNNNALFILPGDRPAMPTRSVCLIPALAMPAIPRQRTVDRGGKDILFVSGNGIGQGHLTRQLAVARHLPNGFSAAFLTMSYSAAIAQSLGFSVHFLPHHLATGEESVEWNRRLTHEIELLLDARGSKTLVYDLNFVFDGLIDVLKRRAWLKTMWIRRAMWPQHHADYLGASVHFDMVAEPGEFSREYDLGPTRGEAYKARLVAPVLLTDPGDRLEKDAARATLCLPQEATILLLDIGRTSNPDLARRHEEIAERLLRRPGLHLVEFVSALSSSLSSKEIAPNRSKIVAYPAFRFSKAWDGAILRSSYNAFHESIVGSVPTLFVPDETSDMDRQIDRARWAEDHQVGLRLLGSDTGNELEAKLDRLLCEDTRSRLAAACDRLTSSSGGWRNGAVEIAELLTGA
ncbi:class I SAM-dependent methyltransferase [Rhizobium laguerreae]|uniref:class I SAM-dependent methyltransferase n=1 Tax=Rhizobium laguerreae TaxID=1076926 RepID=UPI001C916FAF|nr:methyltransferase domain-containing protein [Rhizobium laguerreae]MBY3348009.1 methyltransferase domain-containing protein [Rhizobium laguerreae]MBY3354972.1 methyltransferase domain-containing protein [Rhizobium laguerreae]MBY3376277.1 methyltransferase domain-containing protein [Rhizobium laguerreae]MBY3431276.1 methyltransferase domain-containing protein [Rhizobium laguerreae]MBY3439891.1 methyltransferase domain-containing protein [Rhizobium laguerreae]